MSRLQKVFSGFCKTRGEIKEYPSRKGKYCSFACTKYKPAPKSAFRKGHLSWNKGQKGLKTYHNISGLHPRKAGWKHTSEANEKNRQAHLGKTAWNKGLRGYRAGPLNNMWKGGITTVNKQERTRFRQTMQKLIFERDSYTCQLCGIKGGYLQVDHIQSWAEYVELRFSMDNCRTLCQKCHYKITFGREMPKFLETWGHNLSQIERKVD